MSLSSSLELPPVGSTAATATSRPLFFYPINPEWRASAKPGTLAATAYGWGQGTVFAIWKDTGIGSTAFSNAFNLLVLSSSFFALREFAISPLLCQVGLLEDHRRRYQLAKMASPEHISPDDPPLGPEKWSHIRYRRLLDSGITGGILALALPKWYRHLLHNAGYDAHIRMSPRHVAIAFSSSFVVTSALQLAYNFYQIHDIHLHSAYDALGPIPGIDIARVRAQEKADLERMALITAHALEVEEKKQRAKKGMQLNEDTGLEERRLEWWEWERFMRDAMPQYVRVSGREVLEGLRGKREKMRSELEEVKMELEEMGEVMDLVLAKEGVVLEE